MTKKEEKIARLVKAYDEEKFRNALADVLALDKFRVEVIAEAVALICSKEREEARSAGWSEGFEQGRPS